MENWEDPLPMTVVGIKVEHEVCCMSLCPLLGISESYPELPFLFLICIRYMKHFQSGEEVNSGKILFDIFQEDFILFHIARGVLLPFNVIAMYLKQNTRVVRY
jgi:hypothetical protein